MPIQRALQNDGLNPVAIDQNVLVGGSRRIPAVQALVEKILDKKSTQSVNLDEAVALRAAVQTWLLGGKVKNIRFLNYTLLSLDHT